MVCLGYRATLSGADMSNPDVHLVSMVELEKREYLVDVGYAAPFVTPLPRDLTTDHVITLGRDRYVLRPQDAEGRSRMDLYRDGTLKHGYVATPQPRRIGEFEQVIAESFDDESTFMNALLLARFCPDASLVIHNTAVIEFHDGDSATRTDVNRDQLPAVILEHFGIPPEITSAAVTQLGPFGDPWS
jgi:arylamine N-acetyltransferase